MNVNNLRLSNKIVNLPDDTIKYIFEYVGVITKIDSYKIFSIHGISILWSCKVFNKILHDMIDINVIKEINNFSHSLNVILSNVFIIQSIIDGVISCELLIKIFKNNLLNFLKDPNLNRIFFKITNHLCSNYNDVSIILKIINDLIELHKPATNMIMYSLIISSYKFSKIQIFEKLKDKNYDCVKYCIHQYFINHENALIIVNDDSEIIDYLLKNKIISIKILNTQNFDLLSDKNYINIYSYLQSLIYEIEVNNTNLTIIDEDSNESNIYHELETFQDNVVSCIIAPISQFLNFETFEDFEVVYNEHVERLINHILVLKLDDDTIYKIISECFPSYFNTTHVELFLIKLLSIGKLELFYKHLNYFKTHNFNFNNLNNLINGIILYLYHVKNNEKIQKMEEILNVLNINLLNINIELYVDTPLLIYKYFDKINIKYILNSRYISRLLNESIIHILDHVQSVINFNSLKIKYTNTNIFKCIKILKWLSKNNISLNLSSDNNVSLNLVSENNIINFLIKNKMNVITNF